MAKITIGEPINSNDIVVGDPIRPEGANTALPSEREQMQNLVTNIADWYGIPQDIFHGIARQESDYNPNAIGPETPQTRKVGRAKGMFQFIPATAEEYGITDRLDPKQSADGAARFYKDRLEARGGDHTLALADYNFGATRTDEALEGKREFPPETIKYVKNINGGNLIDYSGTVTKRDDESQIVIGQPIIQEPVGMSHEERRLSQRAEHTPEDAERIKQIQDYEAGLMNEDKAALLFEAQGEGIPYEQAVIEQMDTDLAADAKDRKGAQLVEGTKAVARDTAMGAGQLLTGQAYSKAQAQDLLENGSEADIILRARNAGRSVEDFTQMLQGIAETGELQPEDRNFVEKIQASAPVKGLSEGLISIAEMEALKADPELLKNMTWTEKLVRATPQVVGQVLLTLLPGGATLSMSAMTMQITGSTYQNLRAQGVDHDTALNAALKNGAIQGVMERVGMGGAMGKADKVLDKIPGYAKLKAKIGQRIIKTVTGALSEGGTEAAQEAPDYVIELMAKNPEMSLDEAIAIMAKDPQFYKDAATSGSIGTVLGGGVSTVHQAMQPRRYTTEELENMPQEELDRVPMAEQVRPYLPEGTSEEVVQRTAKAHLEKREAAAKANEEVDDTPYTEGDLSVALQKYVTDVNAPVRRVDPQLHKRLQVAPALKERMEQDLYTLQNKLKESKTSMDATPDIDVVLREQDAGVDTTETAPENINNGAQAIREWFDAFVLRVAQNPELNLVSDNDVALRNEAGDVDIHKAYTAIANSLNEVENAAGKKFSVGTVIDSRATNNILQETDSPTVAMLDLFESLNNFTDYAQVTSDIDTTGNREHSQTVVVQNETEREAQIAKTAAELAEDPTVTPEGRATTKMLTEAMANTEALSAQRAGLEAQNRVIRDRMAAVEANLDLDPDAATQLEMLQDERANNEEALQNAHVAVLENIRSIENNAAYDIIKGNIILNKELGQDRSIVPVIKRGVVTKVAMDKEIADLLHRRSTPSSAGRLWKKAVSGVHSFFRKAVTSWNPVFIVKNSLRDAKTAYVAGGINNPFVFAKEYAKALAQSGMITARSAFGRNKAGDVAYIYDRLNRGKKLSAVDKANILYRNYVQAGGSLGYTKDRSLAKIERASKGYKNSRPKTWTKIYRMPLKVLKGLHKATTGGYAHIMEEISSMIELTPRLAIYKRAMEEAGFKIVGLEGSNFDKDAVTDSVAENLRGRKTKIGYMDATSVDKDKMNALIGRHALFAEEANLQKRKADIEEGARQYDEYYETNDKSKLKKEGMQYRTAVWDIYRGVAVASRNATADFKKHGAVTGAIGAGVPFFSARFQGFATVARAIGLARNADMVTGKLQDRKANKQQLTKNLAKHFIGGYGVSAMFAALNYAFWFDGDWEEFIDFYKDTKNFVKGAYDVIITDKEVDPKTGETVYKTIAVPKGEVGEAYNSLTDIHQMVTDGDEHGIGEYLGVGFQMLSDVGPINFMEDGEISPTKMLSNFTGSPFVNAIFQGTLNKNVYFDTDVVKKWDKNKPDYQVFNDKTPTSMKVLSEMLYQYTGSDISPDMFQAQVAAFAGPYAELTRVFDEDAASRIGYQLVGKAATRDIRDSIYRMEKDVVKDISTAFREGNPQKAKELMVAWNKKLKLNRVAVAKHKDLSVADRKKALGNIKRLMISGNEFNKLRRQYSRSKK